MRHDVSVTGYAYRLRPVVLSDASFITRLRNDGDRKGFLHRGARTVAEQKVWLEDYFNRPGDFYFLIEKKDDASPEGAVGIYGLSDDGKAAEWGRWVLRKGSLAAPESAFLVYNVAFETLDLDQVYCRTILSNSSVISFHDHSGIPRRRLIDNYAVIDGVCFAAVEHVAKRSEWPACGDKLMQTAQRVAALLAR